MFKRLFKRVIGHLTKREEHEWLPKCPCCGEPTNIIKDGLCKECWERIYGGVWEPLSRVENTRVAADADVFDEDLTAPYDGFWRVDVEVGDPCSAAVRLTNDGGSRLLWLNGGSPLVPNKKYTLWVLAKKGDRLNVRLSRETVASVEVSIRRSVV